MDLAGRSIAVTGATGFLGRYICRALLGRGARVVAVARAPERGAELSAAGAELRKADLLDPKALRVAFEGVDAIVANAGLVQSKQSSEFVRVNVEGTQNLIRAAVDAEIVRLIVVSTVSIYLHAGRGCDDEDAPQVPYTASNLRRRPYAATKARGEALAWEAAEEAALQVTAVRPGYIYGRGAGFLEAFGAGLAGRVALIPCFKRIPLAYAGDVAEAIARCLERPVSVGRSYNLTGSEDLSWYDLARAWAEAGGPVARIKLPVPRVVRHHYDTSRAEKDLDWENTSFLEALEETLQPPDVGRSGPKE